MTTASRTVKTIVVRGDHCLLNQIGLIPASLNLAVIEHAHTNKYRTGLATISVTRPLRSESLTTRFERNRDVSSIDPAAAAGGNSMFVDPCRGILTRIFSNDGSACRLYAKSKAQFVS